MTAAVLAGCDPRVLLSHMALYGAAAIVHENGVEDLRLSWTRGMTPRPQLSGNGLDLAEVAKMVRAHASRRIGVDRWPSAMWSQGGKVRALMSPRIARVQDWPGLQGARHSVLDQLLAERRYLDLRLLGCLGEPSYWRFNRQQEPLQDDGASRLEMQPRNQGSEFVGNRVRPLAAAVAARRIEDVATGLGGDTVVDEIGKNAPDSRTGTGFTSPQPVDNAVAWCALWGITSFALAQRVASTARTTGHGGRTGGGYVGVPTWSVPWTLARLRTVITSNALRGFTEPDAEESVTELAEIERRWLVDRGVTGVVRFPIERFGSASAPERRAGLGQIVRLQGS